MPDFAKALKPLRQPRSSKQVSLASQLEFLRARWKKQQLDPAPAVTGVTPDGCALAGLHSQSLMIPAGKVETTPLGSHYVIRVVYPHEYFHGKIHLSRFSCADLESLMTLMREEGAVPSRDRIVFLDTETTGIHGGAGMCPFLVGLGYFVGDEFHVLQYFIRDLDEEPSMLLALGEFLRRFELVVTYNGAAFDLPLLDTRFTLARLESPFRNVPHLDLLFTTSRLWRNGHGSCRLTALEREMISFLRGPDVPGSMIPRAYFDYLQHRPNPNLRGVFIHNVHDVVSLAALTLYASDRVTLEPAPLDDPADLYSIGRIYENSRDWRRSIQLYEMALSGGLLDPFRKKTLENLSVICCRAGGHERSRELCAELMTHAEFSIPGYEGAAIYHERVSGDLDRALQILDEGVRRAGSKRWKVLLKARWDRLQQKMIRYD